MKSLLRFVFVFFAFQLAAASQSQEIRTLNLDFGNGPAYVGDNGILSSSGGTYWNKVNVDNNGIVPLYSFLDEFGQPFLPNHDFLFAEVSGESIYPHGNAIGQANTSLGAGPLSDGVTFVNNNSLPSFPDPSAYRQAVQIRELSPLTPVSVVVYFNNPGPGGLSTNRVEFSTSFGYPSGIGGTESTIGFSLAFPGTDYLRFDYAPLEYTTLGDPPTFGISLLIPPESTAHIAAIQIRGHFASIPEPSSIMLLGACVCFTLSKRGWS